jgi:hypothetical protein
MKLLLFMQIVYSIFLIKDDLVSPGEIRGRLYARDVHWPVKNGKNLITKNYNAKVVVELMFKLVPAIYYLYQVKNNAILLLLFNIK